MAEAMKRCMMVGAASTWSSANGAAAGRISNRSRSTVGLFSTARAPKAFQAWTGDSPAPAEPRAVPVTTWRARDGLRLPTVRLGTIVFAEADPAVVRKGLGFRRRDRLLRGSRRRLLMSCIDQRRLAVLILGPGPEVA